MNAAIAFGTGLLFAVWAALSATNGYPNLVVWVLFAVAGIFCIPVTLLQLRDDLHITSRKGRAGD